MPTVEVGGKPFECPKWADTVISGWTMDGGEVVAEGYYITTPWPDYQIERVKEANRPYTERSFRGRVWSWLERTARGEWVDNWEFKDGEWIEWPEWHLQRWNKLLRRWTGYTPSQSDQSVEVAGNVVRNFDGAAFYIHGDVQGASVSNNIATATKHGMEMGL